MKALRQVSRQFLRMIEAYKRFKDAQVLPFTGRKPVRFQYYFNLALTKDDALERNRICCWRGIRIDVCKLRGHTREIPSAILNNVQFVSLVRYWRYSVSLTCDRDICYVLYSTPKICHLQLAQSVFQIQIKLSDVFRDKNVQGNLKNLKHLDIRGWKNCCNGNDDRTLNTETYDDQANSLITLASILQRLESLRIPKLAFHEDQKVVVQTAIVDQLQRNRESLWELSLHLDFWEQQNICAVKLPRLKLLTGTVRKTDQDTLRDFLVNHADTLEEVDVAVKEEFVKNLFDVIKQRFCPKLIKLRLKSKKFVDSVGGREEFIDWTFLGTMTRLKDFQLSRPKCNNANWEAYGNGSRLLESLPRNQLQRLGFRGIGWRTCTFWRRNELDDEPELSFKLDLLRGFLNLRRLSLRYCPDAVDDDVMRFIVTRMTSLEELEVSHCSKLTNNGISGTLEEGSDSIGNLKRESNVVNGLKK